MTEYICNFIHPPSKFKETVTTVPGTLLKLIINWKDLTAETVVNVYDGTNIIDTINFEIYPDGQEIIFNTPITSGIILEMFPEGCATYTIIYE